MTTAAIQTEPPKPFGGPFHRLLVTYGLLIVLIVAWQIITSVFSTPFFPSPVTIAQRFWSLYFVDITGSFPTSLPRDALPTLLRMLAGFLVGSAVGVLLGIVTGLSRIFASTTSWIVEFLRAIPATATLPLFILILGGADGMRVAFIAYGISWYVLINTAAGVRAIDPTLLLVGRAFRKPRATQVLTLVIPAAMPSIFASLRLATGGALILAIASEFLVATNGIGYRLLIAQASFKMVDLWCWIILLALIGLVLNTILELIEKKVLAWHVLSHR